MTEKHREIILGPPGTGKTTELIRRLEAAFESGIMPEEVAYLAFTKKAADVAIQRSVAHFGFQRSRFPYFRTIHSLAYHEHEIKSQDVMRPEHYKEFGQNFGWDFDAAYDDRAERVNYGRGNGDQLLQCYDLSKARGVTPEEEAKIGDYKFGSLALTTFVAQFEQYRSRYGLQTFNDFLMRPVDIDVRLVIIDEAQDLTHQQWQFIRNSFRNVQTILIAGDDDQCIYQWSGADLNFFLRIEAVKTQLRKSHRCDRRIWEIANRISTRIGNRYEKSWQPVNEGGEVRHTRDVFEVDITKGEWMVLVRKNRHLPRYYAFCMAQGRIFHDGYRWTNETPWFRGVLAYMALREGRLVNAHDVQQLLKVTSMCMKRLELNEYKWEDLNWAFKERPEWTKVCDLLDYKYHVYIQRCLTNGEDITRNGHVRLSTIHAAKGGEADNVILDTHLDGIPLKQFRKDPDSERRVWYVGVSRARHQLVLTGATSNEAIST